jgi:anti-anti-sigma regulatory factor
MEVRIAMLGSGVVEVAPIGVLDEMTLGQLRPHLLDRSESVLLDLSGVERIDAAAIALVMLARIEIEAAGRTFVVQAPKPRIGPTLERAGLPRFVNVANERVEALRALRQPRPLAA